MNLLNIVLLMLYSAMIMLWHFEAVFYIDVLYNFMMYGRRLFFRVLEMGLYEVPIFMCLMGFRMDIMFSNCRVVWVMLLINAMFLFQEDTACLRLERYRHLYKLGQHNPASRNGGPISFFVQAGRRWFCSSQKWGSSSPIQARRHTQINTLQSYGFVTSVTNK